MSYMEKQKKYLLPIFRRSENLIREMGYVQKMGLRVLNKEKSQLIAVVINYHKDFRDSIIGDPFYGKIIGFIEKYVQELGYYLMLYSAKDTDKIFQMVMGWDVDGVIAISFSKSNCEKIYQLINKPIVSIDAYGELDAGQEKHVLNIGLDDRKRRLSYEQNIFWNAAMSISRFVQAVIMVWTIFVTWALSGRRRILQRKSRRCSLLLLE